MREKILLLFAVSIFVVSINCALAVNGKGADAEDPSSEEKASLSETEFLDRGPAGTGEGRTSAVQSPASSPSSAGTRIVNLPPQRIAPCMISSVQQKWTNGALTEMTTTVVFISGATVSTTTATGFINNDPTKPTKEISIFPGSNQVTENNYQYSANGNAVVKSTSVIKDSTTGKVQFDQVTDLDKGEVIIIDNINNLKTTVDLKNKLKTVIIYDKTGTKVVKEQKFTGKEAVAGFAAAAGPYIWVNLQKFFTSDTGKQPNPETPSGGENSGQGPSIIVPLQGLGTRVVELSPKDVGMGLTRYEQLIYNDGVLVEAKAIDRTNREGTVIREVTKKGFFNNDFNKPLNEIVADKTTNKTFEHTHSYTPAGVEIAAEEPLPKPAPVHTAGGLHRPKRTDEIEKEKAEMQEETSRSQRGYSGEMEEPSITGGPDSQTFERQGFEQQRESIKGGEVTHPQAGQREDHLH